MGRTENRNILSFFLSSRQFFTETRETANGRRQRSIDGCVVEKYR
jgi:hypothetical protein